MRTSDAGSWGIQGSGITANFTELFGAIVENNTVYCLPTQGRTIYFPGGQNLWATGNRTMGGLGYYASAVLDNAATNSYVPISTSATPAANDNIRITNVLNVTAYSYPPIQRYTPKSGYNY